MRRRQFDKSRDMVYILAQKDCHDRGNEMKGASMLNLPVTIQSTEVSYEIEFGNSSPRIGILLDIFLEFDFSLEAGTLTIGLSGRREEAISESNFKTICDRLSEGGWLYKKGESGNASCSMVFESRGVETTTCESLTSILKYLVHRLGTATTIIKSVDIQWCPVNDVELLQGQLQHALPQQ